MDKVDLAVIGCGPAGMFAGITAARNCGPGGIRIFDTNVKAGRKLAVTGNGRCNLTNADMTPEHYHGRNPRFVNGILARFSNTDLLEYFGALGVAFRLEEGGRYFPVTDQSASILDNLVLELERHGVGISLQTRIGAVRRDQDGLFRIVCHGQGKNPEELVVKKVVIATGGLTYPRLGASPDGYAFARAFGHTIIDPVPSLTGFETPEKQLLDLQGVKMTAEAGFGRLKVRGDVMFTHYGISGPAIFDLSPFIVRDGSAEKRVLLDFFPDLSVEELEARVMGIWGQNSGRAFGNSLIGILPKKFFQVLVRNVLRQGVETPVSRVSREVRKELVSALKSLPIRIGRPRGFEEAQATAGGVSTDEVDPRSMESRLCPGLYFCGEVLDIDGDCGGYNLQFAFSSGFAAGSAAV